MTWIRTRAATSVGIGIADQALSSLLGLAVAVAVARSVPTDAFGAFALTLATYYVALGTSRALTSEPFVVRFSGASREDFAREVPCAAGAALVVALGASLLCEAAALVAAGPIRASLAALGIALPVLLVQDYLRFAAFSQRRGTIALTSDVIWVVGVGAAMGLVFAVGTSSAGLLVLAWGLPALGGVAFCTIKLRIWPDVRGARRWWRSQHDLAPRYLGEFFASSGANQLALYLVGAIAGLAAAGALRAGQVLLGPLNVLFMGLALVTVPEAVGLAHRSHDRLLRFSVVLSTALTASALAWGAAVVFLPSSIGESLLGDSWSAAASVAPFMAVAMAGSGAITGAFVGLRALAAARRSLRVRVTLAPLVLASAAVGAYAGGARGAAVGLAATMWVGVVIWWHSYIVELRSRKVRRTTDPTSDLLLMTAADG